MNTNNKKQKRSSRLRKNGNKHFGSVSPNQLYAQTFPQQMKVQLTYYDQFEVALSAPPIASDRVFNLNSIFDPDRTGTGHQPLGHDQWNVFYHRYRVDECTVEVTWTSLQSDGAGVNCVIVGTNDVTPITDVSIANELPLGKSGSFTTGSRPLKLRKTYNLANLVGVTRSKYNEDDLFSSIFGADPPESLLLHVVTTAVSGTADNVSFTVKLMYEVTMFDPFMLSRSLESKKDPVDNSQLLSKLTEVLSPKQPILKPKA